MNPGDRNPEQVAVLAPLGRDAELICRVLGEDLIDATSCPDLPGLLPLLASSAVAVVTEESLQTADISGLVAKIEAQPPWSDYPFILLTLRGGGQDRNPAAIRHMRALGNVTFLERPFHPMTLVSLVRTALASRRRQYQARDRLAALEASRAELARSDDRLKFALQAGRLGAWELDLVRMELNTSDQAKVNFGVSPEADLTYSGLMQLIHPRDRARVTEAVQVSIDSRADYEIEYRVLTGAGETRWVELRGRASYDGDQPIRMVGVSLDVTQRKFAEERQHLLIRELHHRVKNTLSTVQAIVGSTARGATTIDDFYRDFTGRIMSLANTHSILTEELWQRASLHDLLSKELDLYDDGHARVRVSGPEVELPSDYAVPLGMAFHELATNAAKYGALSNGEGHVDVTWSVDPDGDAKRLHLSWIEAGGPPVATPQRQGFGTRLLERVLTAQVKAEIGTDYDPGGLKLSMTFALPDPGRPTTPGLAP
ncbi:sensor histidine kinase [uncultured Enterovirga sp.]|uniref:sensor histidine kinase n=1 Tax=uncultured Enterovirga sp. TaxID=2026352 RepID=UPI0035C9C7E8